MVYTYYEIKRIIVGEELNRNQKCRGNSRIAQRVEKMQIETI